MNIADISENEKEYIITMHIPGVQESDIVITAEDESITVHAVGKIIDADIVEGVPRLDATIAAHDRTIVLGEKAHVTGLQSTFIAGWLEIRVPKEEESTEDE